MASLTIRNLEEQIKDLLRIRAASNGNSMEEEVRQILRHTLLQNTQLSQENHDLTNTIKPPKMKTSQRFTAWGTNILPFIPIPGVGNIASGLKDVIQAKYNVQVDEWRKQVSEAINTLYDLGFDDQSLSENHPFSQTFIEALQIASKLVPIEKLSYLRAALISVGSGEIDEENRPIFMRFIQEFDVAHIRTLKILVNPSTPIMVGESLEDYCKKHLNQRQSSFYIRDFNQYGLIYDLNEDTGKIARIFEENPIHEPIPRSKPIVSGFGLAFLRFIDEYPIEEQYT